jgi:hypothetical protein
VAKLICAGITSLDGCIADTDGRFDWAVPDEEVHAFIKDRERAIDTYVFGRRMDEEMAGWEADDPARDQVPEMRDFARVWRSIDRSSTPGRSRTCPLPGPGSRFAILITGREPRTGAVRRVTGGRPAS